MARKLLGMLLYGAGVLGAVFSMARLLGSVIASLGSPAPTIYIAPVVESAFCFIGSFIVMFFSKKLIVGNTKPDDDNSVET